MPDPHEGAAPAPIPAWALDKRVKSSTTDETPGRSTSVREVAREHQDHEDERHDEPDDPDEGGGA
jgi:hypothetical protein